MDDVEVETRGRHNEQPPREESAARWPRVPAQVSQRMRPSRRTLTGLAAAVVAVLAVAGILLSKVGDPVGLARGLLRIATPTDLPPVPLDATWFYLENGIPWGVLTIDDHKRADLDTGTLATLLLPRGRHTFAYDAAPFPPLRCVASVPADAHDTCPLDREFTPDTGAPLGLKRALDLSATLDRLPADQRAALDTAAQRLIALDPTPATVAPGERYRDADGTIVTATQPLRATLVRAPWGDAPGLGFAANCPFLCPASPPSPSSSSSQPPRTWNLLVHVREGYRYETPDGQVVVELAPLGPPGQSGGDRREGLVSLHVRWDGAWQVTSEASPAGSITCDAALGMAPYGSGAFVQPPYTIGPALSAPHPADGCVVSLAPTPSNPNPPAGPINYLYRFGVLLAVTPAALDITTTTKGSAILEATPDEQALAATIIAQSH